MPVYVFHAYNTNLFKIGYTRGNVDMRMKCVQTNCPYELSVVMYFCWRGSNTDVKNTLEQYTESFLHKMYEANRTKGEWFNLSENDLWNMLDVVNMTPLPDGGWWRTYEWITDVVRKEYKGDFSEVTLKLRYN